jgi:hypothetical protein
MPIQEPARDRAATVPAQIAVVANRCLQCQMSPWGLAAANACERSPARPVAPTPAPNAPSTQARQRSRVRSGEVVLLASIKDGIIEAVACNGD